MSLFIAHPTVEGNYLQVVLFSMDDYVNQGTAEFCQQIIIDLDLPSNIEAISWEITPARSEYFSEYLDTGDWEDRFRRVWIAKILCNDLKYVLFRLPDLFLESSANDTTWTEHRKESEELKTNAIIMADFGSYEEIEKAKNAITKAHKKEVVKMQQITIYMGFPELFIDLGPRTKSFFEAPELYDSIQKICTSLNATTNYQERFA